MKFQDSSDSLEDASIQLNFGEITPSIENMQFLDTGIIDLDCDSNEDFKSRAEDSIDGLLRETTSLQPATATRSNYITKSLTIKLVDCYKFPWYINRSKKCREVEKNLAISSSVNIKVNEEIMAASSETPVNVFDKCIDKVNNDNMFSRNVRHNINQQLLDTSLNQSKRKTDTGLAKDLDINRVTKPKRLVNNKRYDNELRTALSQRNQTKVDIKKNKGLVGIQIKRKPIDNQAMKIISMARKQTEIQKETVELDSSKYEHTVDKLNCMGTTITPWFIETINVEIGKDNKTGKRLEHSSVDNLSTTKMNEITKAAQEIIERCTQSEENKNNLIDHKKKLCKPMPFSKKREKESGFMNGVLGSTLQQQNSPKAHKMTKMVEPLPLSIKARTKLKTNTVKQNMKTCDVKENDIPILETSDVIIVKSKLNINKQDTENVQTQNVPGFCTQITDANAPKKSFPSLNKYTENILNKIKQRSKSSKLEKLHKKYAKTTKLNVSTDLLDSKGEISAEKMADIVNDKSPKISPTQPQYSNKNSTKSKIQENHRRFPHANNKLPLNTIIMKTAKTDDAKIDGMANISNVDMAESNPTNINNPASQSIPATTQDSTASKTTLKGPRKQSFEVDTLAADIQIYDSIKNNRYPKLPNDLAQQPLNTRNIPTIITNRNEYTEELDTHVPLSHVTASVISPTQILNHQTQEKQALPVQSSLRSHILYKPQAENRSPHLIPYTEALQHQTLMLQVNQQSYHQSVASTWYPPIAEVFNLSKRIISPQMDMSNKPVLPAVNSGVGMNIRPQRIPIQRDRTKKRLPPSVNKQMGMNATQGSPTQMNINSRSKVCDVQPFWSHTFPPPFPPPPPPPRTFCSPVLPPPPPYLSPPQHLNNTTGFPIITNPADSSIIGRNYEGVIKKIPLNANPIISNNKPKRKDVVEIDGVLESEPVASKTEMRQVLDTSTQRMQSPSETFNVSYSIALEKGPTDLKQPMLVNGSPIDLKSSLPVERSKHELPQYIPQSMNNYSNVNDVLLFESKGVRITNRNTALPYQSNTKKGMSEEYNASCSGPIHATQVTSNQPPLTNVAGTTDFRYLFNPNPKRTGPSKERKTKSNEHTINQVSNSKALALNAKEIPKTSKKPLSVIDKKNSLTAKSKPGPLSKKIKFNDPRFSPDRTKQDSALPDVGYSPPILPIQPYYENITSEVPVVSNFFYDGPIEESNNWFDKNDKSKVNNMNTNLYRKRKHPEQNIKEYSTKKISIDEPKQRSTSEKRDEKVSVNKQNETYNRYTKSIDDYKQRSASERRNEKANINKQNETYTHAVGTPRRASNVDSDLGYDSDVTIKL